MTRLAALALITGLSACTQLCPSIFPNELKDPSRVCVQIRIPY